LAKGDFTGGIDIDQEDEIGMLAAALKKTQGDLSRMFGATIKVEGIQGTTSTTVAEIEQITQVIRSANDIVCAIATAVGTAEHRHPGNHRQHQPGLARDSGSQ
jgi:methyl-accepting chemotaxis protein